MSKIAAFDLGDQWTGIALSDIQRIIGSPDTTVATENLFSFLPDYIKKNKIEIILVGIPMTVRAKETDQTVKTKIIFEKLKNTFSYINFICQDERFSSQYAKDALKGSKHTTKEQIKEKKLKSHAIAAAFILNNYLQMLSNTNEEVHF